ncbi:LysE family translocator [Enterobacter hormaechei]|uniref:LysE family translocator n=1 Tax=Enterobacter hormaechei TaxID=158836 RepID=UPI003CF162B7
MSALENLLEYYSLSLAAQLLNCSTAQLLNCSTAQLLNCSTAMILSGEQFKLHAQFLLTTSKWAGAAYLMWLGIKMIATSGTDTRLRKTAKISDSNAVKEGALNSLTNPNSLLFMFAFLPQFVDPAADPVWLQFLVLGSIQKLAGIVSLRSVVKASGTFEIWLGKHPGVVMISLGIRILFSGSGVVSISAS